MGVMSGEDVKPVIEFKKVDVPIQFKQLISEKTLLGWKVKCPSHGWQKLIEDDLRRTPKGFNAPLGNEPYDTVNFTWSVHTDLKRLLADYESGKTKSFAMFIQALFSIHQRLKSVADLAELAETTLTLPCGCTVGVIFGGNLEELKEPKLTDALLKLGLKTDADMRLIARTQFFPDLERNGETQLLMDKCKQRAQDIMKVLREANEELSALDKFLSDVKIMLPKYKIEFDTADVKLQITRRKDDLALFMQRTVDDLISPLRILEQFKVVYKEVR